MDGWMLGGEEEGLCLRMRICGQDWDGMGHLEWNRKEYEREGNGQGVEAEGSAPWF